MTAPRVLLKHCTCQAPTKTKDPPADGTTRRTSLTPPLPGCPPLPSSRPVPLPFGTCAQAAHSTCCTLSGTGSCSVASVIMGCSRLMYRNGLAVGLAVRLAEGLTAAPELEAAPGLGTRDAGECPGGSIEEGLGAVTQAEHLFGGGHTRGGTPERCGHGTTRWRTASHPRGFDADVWTAVGTAPPRRRRPAKGRRGCWAVPPGSSAPAAPSPPPPPPGRTGAPECHAPPHSWPGLAPLPSPPLRHAAHHKPRRRPLLTSERQAGALMVSPTGGGRGHGGPPVAILDPDTAVGALKGGGVQPVTGGGGGAGYPNIYTSK